MATVIVFRRNVYGNVLTYPHNEEASRLAELVGARTLNDRHLALARELGIEVQFVEDPRNAQLR